jgi:DNA-binding NtrC family response regulator
MTASPPSRRSVARPWRILLVQRDRWQRGCAGAALAERGCDVTEAGSLGAARYALDRGQFDAVITDISLGDGDGFAVVRAVRKAGQKAPVLVNASTLLAAGSAAARTIWFSSQTVPPALFEAIYGASSDSTQRTHQRSTTATIPLPYTHTNVLASA